MREDSVARFVVANQPPCLVEGWEEKYTAVIIGDEEIGTELLNLLVTMAQTEQNRCILSLITESTVPAKSCEYPLLQTKIVYSGALYDMEWIRSYLNLHKKEISQIYLCMKDQYYTNRMERMIEQTMRPWKPIMTKVYGRNHEQAGLLEDCEKDIVKRLGTQIFYDYAKSHEVEPMWESLSGFEKEANYNSAMHIISKLYLSGLRIQRTSLLEEMTIRTEQEYREEISPSEMEYLARLEHLRWCAFHLIYGYETLTQTENNGILHDKKNRRHICLVPWEELTALSLRYEIDFKKEDRDRVAHIFQYVQGSGHVLVKATPKLSLVGNVPRNGGKREASAYPRK